MGNGRQYLAMEDDALRGDCDIHIYKSSGPGGQHRNKVSSAVRLKHRPTGITAQGDESRSQHENRQIALRRLRMNLACRRRCPIERGQDLPALVQECIFQPRGKAVGSPKRLEIGRKDFRFWHVAAYLLDALEHFESRVGLAADWLGVSTGSLVRVLKSDRHLFAAAQKLRRQFNKTPLT